MAFLDSLAHGIDNETRDLSTITLNGQTAYLFTAHDSKYLHTIMWHHGEDVFVINASLNVDDLILIVETLSRR